VLAGVAIATVARAAPCADPAACAKACSRADPAACVEAAQAYFDGRHGAPLDTKRSFALAKTACDAGDAHGCALLGFHYQDGSGVAWSPERAVAVYERACQGGAGEGCFNLAGMYSGGHGVIVDFDKSDAYKKRAREAWTTACDRGHLPSCTALASMVIEDHDAKRATALYERACTDGYRSGCVQAARLRFEAGALTADKYLAALDEQCRAGESSGCGEAAGALLVGKPGMAQDLARAYAFAERGCDGGDAESCMVRASKGLEAHDEVDERAFAMKACDRHIALACAAAAAIAHDRASARDLYRRACRMGNADACEELAKDLFAAKRDADGVRWAREACRMGHVAACGPLLERDLDLPVPPYAKQKLYAQGCASKIAPACKHVRK